MGKHLDPSYKHKWHLRNKARISQERIAAYKHKIGSMAERRLAFQARLATVTEIDLSYLAGLVDGEGSIIIAQLSKRLGPNYLAYFGCKVEINNTDMGMIEWVYKKFGGAVKWQKGAGINGGPAKDVARWWISGKCASLLCERIYPYLTTVKKTRANLLMQLFRDNNGTPGYELSVSEIAKRKEIMAEYVALR